MGGYSETENTQSAKVCINFHGGGGGILNFRIGVFCMGSIYVLHLLFLNIMLYFMNVWVTTYIYYYFLLFLLYCLYFIKEKLN